ncbi:vWA domain-containing protein [Limnoglobus roseus]|uniref:VWA domain-containing protein n=1 Tax=Limnoglobus roseus TaxID=2598579 RepID=A0A5C1AQJ2_9BACT|nr:vWA domain-containing protein [Limnoglobus roseus]QEL19118.1 VWA domain-containing protein [Limnoglobus roseus]
MSLDLFAASAAGAWLNDAREFLAALRFRHPPLLWLSFVPVIMTLLAWAMRRGQQSGLSRFGRLGAVAALQTLPRGTARLAKLSAVFAWLLLVMAVARPQWGQSEERGVAVGRDVVLVLDFSRSMWAEDMAGRTNPARWQAAVAGATELVEQMRSRGGHRVAVIVFASRPKLVVPLTTDYDHIRFKLGELDARTPPAEVRPADDTASSGTRIGGAIEAAIAAHDPRFPGLQDILLFTDGDDPAEDQEWRSGVTDARNAKVPVHVVGLGDPLHESSVLHRGEFLEAEGKNGVRVPVLTRLHEDVASAIAEETRGAYLPARRDPPQLAAFFQSKIESNATRDVSDERLPQPRERYEWFLGPAGLLLLWVWWRER